jgi:hypothetical protein
MQQGGDEPESRAVLKKLIEDTPNVDVALCVNGCSSELPWGKGQRLHVYKRGGDNRWKDMLRQSCRSLQITQSLESLEVTPNSAWLVYLH